MATPNDIDLLVIRQMRDAIRALDSLGKKGAADLGRQELANVRAAISARPE